MLRDPCKYSPSIWFKRRINISDIFKMWMKLTLNRLRPKAPTVVVRKRFLPFWFPPRVGHTAAICVRKEFGRKVLHKNLHSANLPQHVAKRFPVAKRDLNLTKAVKILTKLFSFFSVHFPSFLYHIQFENRHKFLDD